MIQCLLKQPTQLKLLLQFSAQEEYLVRVRFSTGKSQMSLRTLMRLFWIKLKDAIQAFLMETKNWWNSSQDSNTKRSLKKPSQSTSEEATLSESSQRKDRTSITGTSTTKTTSTQWCTDLCLKTIFLKTPLNPKIPYSQTPLSRSSLETTLASNTWNASFKPLKTRVRPTPESTSFLILKYGLIHQCSACRLPLNSLKPSSLRVGSERR